MAWALAALFVALFTLVLLAPAGRDTPADTLVVGLSAEPGALDPHVTTSSTDFRVAVNLYEGLVRFRDGTLRVEPALAERWTVEDEGRAYTFHLRQGVRFHDGTPFDAEAVRFNLERMLDPEHPFHDTGPFPLSFFFSSVKRVRVLDEYTVRLELEEPFAPLLSNLAYPTGLMVSPEAVRRHGRDVGRHPSGTGPFQLESFEPGRRIVLRRNPSYRGPRPPLERLVFRPLTDEMTRVAELRAGGVDLVLELSPDNVGWLRHTEGFQVHERSGPHLWFLILNTREPPLSDVRMRRALNYAIDKRALVEGVLQDTATVAAGPVPAAFDWAHDATLRPYPYEPERARELVREAGYEGAELTFLVPQGGSGMLAPVQMATAIQADLAAIGLKARIETYEWNTYLEKVNAGLEGQGHMAEMAWMTNDPDTLPYLALRTSARPPDGFNSGYYSNPEVDALLEQARTATDTTERARLYREVQQRVHEDAPWVFVASWRQHAVTSARVRDFRLQPSFLLLLADTSKH